MSDHPLHPGPRLSRRALMKSAAVVPILTIGGRAWAAPTEENMAAFAKVAPIPEAKMKWARDQAVLDAPGVDPDAFEVVVRSLWTHFRVGLGKVGVSNFDLLMLMYDEPKTGTPSKTGALLAAHVKKGDFDPFGNHAQTNICAYFCGHKAATLALAEGRTEITATDYKTARAAVEKEMRDKLTVARAVGQKMRGEAQEPVGAKPAVQPAGLGFGC